MKLSKPCFTLLILLVCFILLCVPTDVFTEEICEEVMGKVVSVQGEIQIKKEGKAELIPAGKILKHKVLSSSSEEIEKGELWWDIEIEAELANI